MDALMDKTMEFKRNKYKYFENSINEVSKRLATLFDEIGAISFKIHRPTEEASPENKVFKNYSSNGTNVVEPNSTYVGYEWSASQRYLAVYVDEKFLSFPLSNEEFLNLIKKHFGDFVIKNSKKDCKESSYRVYIKNSWEVNFNKTTIEALFENTNNHISDFSIIFGGDFKKDQKKFAETLKSLPPMVIY